MLETVILLYSNLFIILLNFKNHLKLYNLCNKTLYKLCLKLKV